MSFGGSELFEVFANGDGESNKRKAEENAPMEIVKKSKQEEEDDENELKTLLDSLPQVLSLFQFYIELVCVKL